MHIKLVGVDRTLHHGFTQTVTGGDEHHLFKARLGVYGEYHARSTQIGADHALNTGRKCHVGMGKALVHAVADGAVVVQRGKHLFDFVQHRVNTRHIQKRFLLTGKRGIRQVFCSGRRPNGKRSPRVFGAQLLKGLSNRLFQVSRESLSFHHGANFSAYCG